MPIMRPITHSLHRINNSCSFISATKPAGKRCPIKLESSFHHLTPPIFYRLSFIIIALPCPMKLSSRPLHSESHTPRPDRYPSHAAALGRFEEGLRSSSRAAGRPRIHHCGQDLGCQIPRGPGPAHHHEATQSGRLDEALALRDEKSASPMPCRCPIPMPKPPKC